MPGEIIKVEPSELRAKAAELRNHREEHDAAMNKIKDLVSQLPEIFMGKAAEAYDQQFTDMQPTFTNFSELLEDLAKKLDNTANRMENEDSDIAQSM